MAILEAAFVTPVFFILIFGIMEVGLAMNDSLALASSVRAGSRVASASGNDLRADMYVVLKVARESAALNRNNIDYIVVYKPGSFGQEPSTLCKGGAPQPDCNVYRGVDMVAAEVQVTEETAALAESRPVDQSKVTYGCTKPNSPDRHWCPTSRKVTQQTTGPDYVGVWMKVQHPWVTKMFGNSVSLTDSSVIRLEPRQS